MDKEMILRFIQNEHALPKLRSALIDRHLQAQGIDYEPNERCILRRISRREGMSQIELASEVFTPAPTVTRKLKKLSDRGLLERKNDFTDYRKNRLYLTEEGKRTAQIVNDVSYQYTELLFEGFTSDERIQFAAFMERMRQNGERALQD